MEDEWFGVGSTEDEFSDLNKRDRKRPREGEPDDEDEVALKMMRRSSCVQSGETSARTASPIPPEVDTCVIAPDIWDLPIPVPDPPSVIVDPDIWNLPTPVISEELEEDEPEEDEPEEEFPESFLRFDRVRFSTWAKDLCHWGGVPFSP